MARVRIIISALFALGIAACDTSQIPPACKIPQSRPVDNGPLVLEPETLASFLFQGNTPIHVASLALRQAKAEVNLARTELLPSIRLGALLLSAGQPQFAWTAVESALSFLIPSNWFRLSQTKKLFEAEKLALQIVEQNQFAQAYSLIRLWQVDQELEAHLKEELLEAEESAQRIRRSFDLGLATLEDKARSQARAVEAKLAAIRMKELLEKEEAALRRVFGIRSQVPVVSGGEWGLLPASSSETRSIDQGVESILAEAMILAPEARQMEALTEASRAGRWASVFGFVGGASITLNPDASGNLAPSLSGLSAGAGLTIGASIFPTIQLSQLNVKQLELRKIELEQELRQTLESLRAQLTSTSDQLVLAKERERAMQSQLKSVQLRVQVGVATLSDLEAAEGAWREAFVARLRASSELSLSRLSWQRLMQEGLFADLPPCMVDLK